MTDYVQELARMIVQFLDILPTILTVAAIGYLIVLIIGIIIMRKYISRVFE